jgi:aspartate/methionine/tyrosine aminotransferase
MDSGMFRGIQEGAIAALKEGDDWFAELTKKYTERREEAEKIIALLNCDYKGGQSGMFLWARISDDYEDAKQIADEILYGAHVFITPGNIFGSNGNKYIRISLCQPKELIEKARKRIEAFKKGK